MLLDTASMYFRAFFGVPEITAPDGTPVNAVRGLLDFIARLVGEYRPTDLVCCWDEDWRPQWRVDLLPSYKAHRVVGRAAERRRTSRRCPTRWRSRSRSSCEVLDAFGICVIGAPAATRPTTSSARWRPVPGQPVDVVTGDRDLFQLVDDEADVRVLYIGRGVSKHERVDNAWVRDEVRHRRRAVRRLRDAPRRRLRRAAGRGRASATRPRRRCSTGSATWPASSPPSTTPTPTWVPGPRGKIKAAADYLAVAPQVVAVARDLDLDRSGIACPVTPPDPARVVELAERYNLESPAARLVQALTR